MGSAATTVSQPATVGAALAEADAALRAAGVPGPRLDALLLLGEVLAANKAALLAHPERPLADAEQMAFAALVARRAGRAPLAYLLGRREFYGRELLVSPAVLVPRPETELLVELSREHLERVHAGAWAADVGTGSGALAVTLAAEHPGLRLLAIDRSPAALAVARSNARRHGVEPRVAFLAGDLLAGIRGALGLVVANLPYIPTETIDGLMPEVARHEPRLALDGGADGLALNRRLLAEARERLAPGALLLLEMGADQGAALRAAASACFPAADVTVVRDLAGEDRVLRVRLEG